MSGLGALPGWRADGSGQADGEFACERWLWRNGSMTYVNETPPFGVNSVVQYCGAEKA